MADSFKPLDWDQAPDACIEYALAGAGVGVEGWLSQFPLLAPVASQLAANAVGLLRRELCAARTDPARYVTQYDALRHSVIVCRRWAMREVLVSRPIQPLLTALATSTHAPNRALYRFVLCAYREALGLNDLADAMGFPRTEAFERVLTDWERWNDIVYAASGNAACGESFPIPDALR